MSLLMIVQELWRLLKDSVWKLIMGGALFGLLFAGCRYFGSQWGQETSSDQQSLLSIVYDQEPAEFQAVIVDEAGDLFGNSFVIDEYFRTPQVVATIEEKTGTDFQKVLETEISDGVAIDSDYRGGLAAIRNTSSDVMTFRFLVGQSTEDNLKIAKSYQQFLEEEGLPFLKNSEIVIMHEAQSHEFLTEEELSMVAGKGLSGYLNDVRTPSVMVYGISGVIFGTLITAGLIFLHRFFAKRVAYAFEYQWELENTHLVLDTATDPTGEGLRTLMKIPVVTQRFILAESHLERYRQQDELDLSTETFYFDHLQEALSQTQVPDEIVIIIESKKTHKAWLNTQMQLAELYHCPVKLIHLY